MLSCHYCVAASPDNFHFCSQCGRSLNNRTPSIAGRKSSRRMYVGWIMLVIALIIIGTGTFKALPLLASSRALTKTTPKAEAPTRTSPNFHSFVGTWYAHGRGLIFSANGHAQYVARTYQWCGQGVPSPCDSIQGNEIISGVMEKFVFTRTVGQNAYGTVISSTVGNTGAQVTVRLQSQDTLALYDGSSLDGILCGPQAPVGYCGA
jgi:hypothetical protein